MNVQNFYLIIFKFRMARTIKMLQNLKIVLDIMSLDLTQTKQHVALNKDSPLAEKTNTKKWVKGN